ncbi:hypothetical protein Tco_0066661, partial [Tanacetum coccineum]
PSHSAFVSTTNASKKMSYLDSPCYSSSTYTVPSNSKTGSHRSGNIIEHVLQSFVADTEPEQQMAYEDFDQIKKLDLEEMDLKCQMANGYAFCHFARKCRAKGGNDKQRHSSFKIQEIGKKEEDSKALITVDTLVDWTEHDGQSDGVIAPKEFGMIAGCDTEDAIEEGVASTFIKSKKHFTLFTKPRSTQAPPAGHTSGGAEDLITLTAVSSVVSTLVQKSKKRKVVVSDSDQEEGGEPDVDLDALLALANAAVIVDSNIPPGGASSSHIPTDVPTGVAPAGVSNKGKTPMVEEDITVKERTLKQMEDDRLGEEAAKRLHDEEQAQVDRQRAELNRRRQQEVLASAMYYTEADWINIMAQVEANASLSKTLLGDDVTEDNFPVRMAALIKRKKQALAEKLAKERMERPMTPVQQRTYMRQFVKNQSSALYSTGWTKAKVESFTDAQLKEEFEKIQKALANTQVQAFSRTLKRTGPELEEPSSKQQKSTEAPIPSVPDVSQPPVVSSPKSSGTRRKSLRRNRLTKPKSILKELDLDADDKTFIKVVFDEDSTDEAPILWSALAGWEVISIPLGEINALYSTIYDVFDIGEAREVDEDGLNRRDIVG